MTAKGNVIFKSINEYLRLLHFLLTTNNLSNDDAMKIMTHYICGECDNSTKTNLNDTTPISYENTIFNVKTDFLNALTQFAINIRYYNNYKINDLNKLGHINNMLKMLVKSKTLDNNNQTISDDKIVSVEKCIGEQIKQKLSFENNYTLSSNDYQQILNELEKKCTNDEIVNCLTSISNKLHLKINNSNGEKYPFRELINMSELANSDIYFYEKYFTFIIENNIVNLSEINDENRMNARIQINLINVPNNNVSECVNCIVSIQEIFPKFLRNYFNNYLMYVSGLSESKIEYKLDCYENYFTKDSSILNVINDFKPSKNNLNVQTAGGRINEHNFKNVLFYIARNYKSFGDYCEKIFNKIYDFFGRIDTENNINNSNICGFFDFLLYAFGVLEYEVKNEIYDSFIDIIYLLYYLAINEQYAKPDPHQNPETSSRTHPETFSDMDPDVRSEISSDTHLETDFHIHPHTNLNIDLDTNTIFTRCNNLIMSLLWKIMSKYKKKLYSISSEMLDDDLFNSQSQKLKFYIITPDIFCDLAYQNSKLKNYIFSTNLNNEANMVKNIMENIENNNDKNADKYFFPIPNDLFYFQNDKFIVNDIDKCKKLIDHMNNILIKIQNFKKKNIFTKPKNYHLTFLKKQMTGATFKFPKDDLQHEIIPNVPIEIQQQNQEIMLESKTDKDVRIMPTRGASEKNQYGGLDIYFNPWAVNLDFTKLYKFNLVEKKYELFEPSTYDMQQFRFFVPRNKMEYYTEFFTHLFNENKKLSPYYIYVFLNDLVKSRLDPIIFMMKTFLDLNHLNPLITRNFLSVLQFRMSITKVDTKYEIKFESVNDWNNRIFSVFICSIPSYIDGILKNSDIETIPQRCRKFLTTLKRYLEEKCEDYISPINLGYVGNLINDYKACAEREVRGKKNKLYYDIYNFMNVCYTAVSLYENLGKLNDYFNILVHVSENLYIGDDEKIKSFSTAIKRFDADVLRVLDPKYVEKLDVGEILELFEDFVVHIASTSSDDIAANSDAYLKFLKILSDHSDGEFKNSVGNLIKKYKDMKHMTGGGEVYEKIKTQFDELFALYEKIDNCYASKLDIKDNIIDKSINNFDCAIKSLLIEFKELMEKIKEKEEKEQDQDKKNDEITKIDFEIHILRNGINVLFKRKMENILIQKMIKNDKLKEIFESIEIEKLLSGEKNYLLLELMKLADSTKTNAMIGQNYLTDKNNIAYYDDKMSVYHTNEIKTEEEDEEDASEEDAGEEY